MSWDVALVRIRGDYRPIGDVAEADYLPLGTPSAVGKAIRTAFPKAEWSGIERAVYCRKGFEIEIDLDAVESANTVLLHVHGTGDPIRPLIKLAVDNGWLAVDCSTGQFIDPRNPSYEGWEGYKALTARSAEVRSNEDIQAPTPTEWPLSGVNRGPNDRYVYLQILSGESPKKLHDGVFRHWRELAQQHDELAGISGPFFVLTLPDGGQFGDFWIRRYPSLLTETWEQFIPCVQEGAERLRDYAVATGRRTGEIEDGTHFVCDDEQRISLAKCTYYKLQTDAEFRLKLKSKKKS